MFFSFNNINSKIIEKKKQTTYIRNLKYEQTPEENRKLLFTKLLNEFLGGDGKNDYRNYVDNISSSDRFKTSNLTYLAAAVSMLTNNEESLRNDNHSFNSNFFETDHWNVILDKLPKTPKSKFKNNNLDDDDDNEVKNKIQILVYSVFCEKLISNKYVYNNYNQFGKERKINDDDDEDNAENNNEFFIDEEEEEDEELEIISDFINKNKIVLDDFN